MQIFSAVHCFEVSMKRIKSAELVRSFSRYSDHAVTEPVLITPHGHDRLVLLSAETYYRLIAKSAERGKNDPRQKKEHLKTV
jgi:PHD/YefM family antitoxin component YafN of YafNO toxin-antitoxin module